VKVGDLVRYTLSNEIGIIIWYPVARIPFRSPVNPRVEMLVHTGECIRCYANRLELIDESAPQIVKIH